MASSLEKVNDRINDTYPYLEFITYNGAKVKSKITDNRCGHIWETRPEYVYLRGLTTKCPICNNTSTKYTEDILKQKLAIKYPDIISFSNYTTSKNYIDIKYKCGHEDSTILSDLMSKGTKSVCRLCNPQSYSNKSHETFAKELYAINPYLQLLDNYKNNITYLTVRDLKCSHEWKILPHNILAKNTLAKCAICEPNQQYSISKGEQSLADYLNNYTKVIRNSRLPNNYEIDILLPDINIGIEYNGEYWHSDIKKDKYYHINKTNLAKDNNIRLIHIFEHEWLYKQDLVKSKLMSILGYNYIIGARECNIKRINFPKQFLIDNHLQGAGTPTNINYGLFLKDLLVAVMTFGTPRFSKEEFELIRFATLTNITIQGGASKLFSAFLKEYAPKSIISYSDKRWSIGNIYKILGFKFSHTSDPGYFYNNHSTILSRYQCQKHKLENLFPHLYDKNLTEREIMANAGFYKVYDCGNDVWVYGTNE